MERKLLDQIKRCLDFEGCGECEYVDEKQIMTCQKLLEKAYEQIKRYEDIFPCSVGDTVYVLTECEKIPQQIDGTLWDSNGGMGTATGYYCPYENDCPFDGEDFEGCEKYTKQTAVFEDTVKSITIEENAVYILTENCGVYSEIGRYVFFEREQAEAELKKSEEMEEQF